MSELLCCQKKLRDRNKDICENIYIKGSLKRTDPIYNNKEFVKNPKKQSCIPFSRSNHLCDVGESSVKEQFNALTSYLDMSAIYGSEKDVSIPLRVKRFKTKNKGSEYVDLGTLVENKEKWNLPTRFAI